MNLYLLKYNNYYNRIVKKESSIEGYLPYQIGNTIQGVNFIPNDFINTQQIVNWNNADPDYVVVVDENNNINSRWFVLSTIRTRKGQLKLDLYRDTVVDFYNSIIEAPCFIEKATVDANDPAIFNKEDMTFNQILSRTTKIYDKSACPWLVGYVARNASTFNNLKIDYEADLVPDYSVNSLSELPFYQHIGKSYTNFSDIAIDMIATDSKYTDTLTINSFNKYGAVELPAYNLANENQNTGFGWVRSSVDQDSRRGYYSQMLEYLGKTAVSTSEIKTGTTGGFVPIDIYEFANKYFTDYLKNAVTTTDWATIKSQVESYTGNAAVNEINQYINQIVKVSDGTYYRVRLSTSSTGSAYSAPISGFDIPVVDRVIRSAYNRAITNYSRDYSTLAAGMSNSVAVTAPTATNIMCTIRTSASTTATLYLERITDTKLSAKLTTSDTHVHLSDAPYDMFCMPYSDVLRIITNNAGSKLEIRSSKALALATMNAIARQGVGANKIHDIQLLPYCPLQQYLTKDGKLDLTQASSIPQNVSRYYFIQDESGVGNLGVFIYCDVSSGEFNVPLNIPVTDYKIQSSCEKYRLCSPNYSSIFEFNAAYNKGVEFFNVDFKYRPYSPYIHVNPNFKPEGLYGKDQNDPRGLICGGEFSITLVSDAWETYQLQNKNYELSFQRQIENMEVTNNIQRQRDIMGAITGTFGGAATGATAGGLLTGGNPIGMAVGGVGGALTSGLGGIADVSLNEKLRNEALDYTKDMYGYNLQNIQALPNTIAKVSTFNPNNKIFPVLEYYTCTGVERQALKDKIKYNGMTVMRIGTIRDFLKAERTYIKGKLIRIEGISEDYHVATAIADEINKGVFI